MTVKELRDYLNGLEPWHDNDTVCVKVFDAKTFGGTPTVKVVSLCSGFDWDSGKHMIITEPEVIRLTKEDRRDIIIDNL